jgi:crotonobetainyl-CoA:carnitine CoA-transferase CaiB-like acyl-CoA transferase
VLSPYRVLDLSDDGALLCGQILADLGADVIQIEPPGGARARARGPFAGGRPDPERSLFWWAYARNKRGIVLDLDTPAGRDALLALAKSADFLIESFPPGEMARRGLGYEALAAANPALCMVSITPFGQQGPKAGWSATDLTLLAAGGPLALTGDEDRAPVRVAVPQAMLHAGAEAAVGALVALHERLASGRGQHVDVSVQQAVTICTQAYILADAVGAPTNARTAGGVKVGRFRVRLVYPAKDGHVSITHLFGSTIGPATRRLMEWVYECGYCDAATRDKDWIAYHALLMRGEEPIEEFERVKEAVARCTASKTKAELFQAALDRSLLIAPIATIRDVAASDQLAARAWWRAHPGPDETPVRYPGPFAHFSAAPIAHRRRAPRLGEHEADLSGDAATRSVGEATTRSAGRATTRENLRGASMGAASTGGRLPLDGVKILDFMWALAGPLATRTLADYGATVVRIESTRRIDVCRTLTPYLDDEIDAENASVFHTTNAGKRMLTLDPTRPGGRQVVLDLVRWADVVAESFTPKGMKGLGLDYETLRRVKPDLIMLSTCLMGQTGPTARFAGFGNLAAALSGFYELAGWPDRAPAGPFGAYTDYIAPRYNAVAILAALEHRRRTDEGQHIDLSQAEASLHFLAPALLDYFVNGEVASRDGNRDREMAPHGVYPCAGDDRWVAIAVRDERDWRALCTAMETPELAEDPGLASAAARLARCDELDARLCAWTRARPMGEVEALLQARGIPASAVQNSPECVRDPQLRLRGHFVSIPHAGKGQAVVEGSRFRLSRTPARIEAPAPSYGLDNQWVLGDLLGYDDERITELVISGALE